MDDIAATAQVSKPTLYRYFAEKERLYAAIVEATMDEIDEVVRMVAEELAGSDDPRNGLRRLANKLVVILMQPDLLRLRRLVIANAERFPQVSQAWFARGFERLIETLAAAFRRYSKYGWLRIDDPMMAANHFTGLLLWILLNRAMFSGSRASEATELAEHAEAAVAAFLEGYGK